MISSPIRVRESSPEPRRLGPNELTPVHQRTSRRLRGEPPEFPLLPEPATVALAIERRITQRSTKHRGHAVHSHNQEVSWNCYFVTAGTLFVFGCFAVLVVSFVSETFFPTRGTSATDFEDGYHQESVKADSQEPVLAGSRNLFKYDGTPKRPSTDRQRTTLQEHPR
ncbi:hypothetical protein HPB50_022015 [Hyalomma asiaticum]|uniref:Uncharacterized protein n=1 Tax=Hyalomma asiaticum TaxID=266040 RepID=A0ACB7T0X5_HYAAI|nr:hypothetical protein HPB50_022015 [Hyalomma asiaticum]